MLTSDRRLGILRHLEKARTAKVDELMRLFDTSRVTILKDLSELEAEGLIWKSRGHASLRSNEGGFWDAAFRNVDHPHEKSTIGRRAAAFVEDGDRLAIDAGTTTSELARHITGRVNLTVVTSSLAVAAHLSALRRSTVYLTGGEYRPGTLSLAGAAALRFLEQISVGKVFLSSRSLAPLARAPDSTLPDVMLKRAMIRAGRRVHVLVDSNKLNHLPLPRLDGLVFAHVVITDGGAQPDRIGRLRDRGLEVIVAGK